MAFRYTSIATTSINYPVTDLLFDIKSHSKEGDTLIICFWDFENFDIETIGVDSSRYLVNQISKLLSGLGVKSHIIYMSDAIRRINRDENISRILTSVKFNINFQKILKVYKKHKYLDISRATLGKINFIATDYIIPLFFKELYPELAKGKTVDYYHSTERLLGIKKEVDETISKLSSPVRFPEIVFWKKIPILKHTSKEWISIKMSKIEIEKEIRKNWPLSKELVKDLVSIGLKIDNLALENRIKNLLRDFDKLSEDVIIQEIVEIFYLYFFNIKKIIDSSEEKGIKKITYVDTKEKLKGILENLNPAKLEILKACDGKKTIEEITAVIPMKSNSVRSYISRMKKEKLITNNKKPLRLVDEIVINLE